MDLIVHGKAPEGSETTGSETTGSETTTSEHEKSGSYLAAVYLFVMLVTGLAVKGTIGSKNLRHLEIPFTVAGKQHSSITATKFYEM
eukprot:5199435-Pyramimonas_sp.AAC.1